MVILLLRRTKFQPLQRTLLPLSGTTKRPFFSSFSISLSLSVSFPAAMAKPKRRNSCKFTNNYILFLSFSLSPIHAFSYGKCIFGSADKHLILTFPPTQAGLHNRSRQSASVATTSLPSHKSQFPSPPTLPYTIPTLPFTTRNVLLPSLFF